MNTYSTPEITDGVFAVGSTDWSRRIFDALAPTPLGTTYNCYLVRGAQKNALIDTVHSGYETELSGKIDQILGSHKIDYIVMNHAEPDHAGSILHFLDKTGAVLLCTKRGAELAGQYYSIPEGRIQIVDTGDSVDLGGKTLSFISAPFIHWPETMMTWLSEAGTLFSCDFFSAHNTTGQFDDQADDVLHWARKYYGEIMMPLAKMGRQAMDKIKDLDIKVIAPSHGPVYRNPETILKAYTDWTSEKTRARAIVVYVTMYHHTEKMALTIVESLKARGIDVLLFDMMRTEPAELAGHLVDTRALVIASPTVLGMIHPKLQYTGIMIKMLRPPVKYGLFVNSYGWGKTASKHAAAYFEEAKIENIGIVEVNGAPNTEDEQNLRDAATALADKILSDE